MRISNIQYTYKPSFGSNREQDLMLSEARKKAEAARKKAQELREQEIKQLINYQIKDPICHDTAQFLLNFSCAIENDSEHNLDEFFKSDDEAAKLRQGLSPECQKNSLELRKEIQSNPILKDPALTLITAKDMKDFAPADEEFVRDKRYQLTINAAKKSVVDAVEASDKSKFDSAEIGIIKKLTQIIQRTEGLDFGAEYNKLLEKLINSVKSRKPIAVEQARNMVPTIQKMLKG